MTRRTKRILIYVAGILTGIVMTYVVTLCMVKYRCDQLQREKDDALARQETEESAESLGDIDDPYYEARKYEETTLFKRPKGEFKALSALVYQVLPSGNARAALMDKQGVLRRVVLLAGEEEYYYDQQEIQITQDKRVRIVGTCRYGDNTFPVVEIADK